MEPSRLTDGGSDVNEGHNEQDHAHHPMQQVQSRHPYGVASPVHRSDAPPPRRESGSMDALLQSPPSPEDIDLAPPAHSSAYPEGQIHSNSFSAPHTDDQLHAASSAADGGKKGGKNISTAVAEPCLAMRAQGSSSSSSSAGLEAAVVLQKPWHHKNRRSQQRSVTIPGQDVSSRWPGRHLHQLSPFCKMPTTVAMGAAVAVRPHISTTSPRTVPNPPLTGIPSQPVITKLPTLDCTDAPRFPAGGTPATGSADRHGEDYRGSPMGDERLPPSCGQENAPSLSVLHVHTMHAPCTTTGMGTPATASVNSTAPADSPGALDYIALPPSGARGARHNIGSPRDVPAAVPTEAPFVGETIIVDDAADVTMSPGNFFLTGAAPPQRLSATRQPKRGDDNLRDPLRDASLASVEDKSLYSLAHSRMPSTSTCTVADATPHEGLMAAATSLERAFTCPEMQASLYHGSAGAERVLMDSSQHRFLDSVQSNPLSPNTLRMSASASAAAAVAAIGVTRSTPLLCPSRADEQGHHRITVATKAEEETLLRQSISAGDAAAIDSTSQSAFLTRSFTAPSHVASTTSVTVPDGWGVSSVVRRSQSLISHHADTPIDVPGDGVGSNAAGEVAVASKAHKRGGMSHSTNSNSLFLGGSFATAVGASSTRGSLPASVFMQQNKSALVAELKLRRHRLQKSLGVLQREVTARNIFALVRASNASQLQHLLQMGLCSVNDRDYNGCTPLHVAAGEGNHTIVRVLLSFGADVVAVDYSGRTPLDCAAANRHSGVAHCLLTVIRNKHLRDDGGGAGATSSGGDDGPLASMRGDGPTTNDGSSTTEAHTSQSDSPAWSAAPLLVSAAEAPASLSTLGTTGRTTQNSTPAQQQRALPGSSPTLFLSIHRQHQPQPWASSSSVTSTPSPSMPENATPTPRLYAAGGHPTDADNWSGIDTPPYVVKRLVDVAAAGAAADDSAAAGSAPPSAAPKILSSLTSENIRGLAARWVLPQSTVQQSFAQQHGSDSTGKSAGAHSNLVRHESLMSLSTSRLRHSSVLHGSSPQRPVFLSSLDSTAAAHSRGLIAAESNGSSSTTAPLPSAGGSGGGGGRGDDDDPHRRPVVSAPPYLAGGMEESSSFEASHATTQRPPSQANTDECRISTATAPGAIAKWPVDGEALVDPQEHHHHLQSESCASLPGGFASASSSSTWCVTPSRIPAEKDVPHNRRDRGIFKETGSFPGEMPTQLSELPRRAAATGATTPAVLTSETPAAAASSVSPQQRPMLLRPPRRPQNRSSATDSQSLPLDTEKDAPPTRMLRPLINLPPDIQDRLDGEHGSDAAFTSMTLTTETSAATQVAARMAPGAPKSSDDLSGSMAASGAGSLRDIGQQSLEEHHHHLRMTAGGMRAPSRQSTLKSNSERYSAPLPTARVPSAPTMTEMLGTLSASGSGGKKSSTAATDKHDDVAQFISHPTAETNAMADAPRSLWSTGAASDAVAPTHRVLATHDPPTTSEAAPPTAGQWPTAESSTLEAIQEESEKLSVLDHSSYTTVSDTVSIIVCMVGLPGRGKSFISERLVRYMNWKGVPCKVFNAGNYRRHLLGVEETACADFFDPNNPQGAQLRERMAELACEDLLKFIASYSLAVGILDATNTTRKRRAWLLDYFHREAQRYGLPYRLLFIESVCTDDAIVTENILRSKCNNEDFKNVKDVGTVIAEFRNRILHYEKVYETLEPEERVPYIKIINVKHHVILHRVPNGLGSRIAFFLLNLHPIAFPIYVALPGETIGDTRHVYGGEERLTARGEAYAMALKNFIQDRYVPHMVVLHATNSCVLSTLAPLMEGAMDEEGANFAQTIGHVNGHGVSGSRAFTHKAPMHEPQHQPTAAKSSEAVQSPLRRLHQDNPSATSEGGRTRGGGDHAGAPLSARPHGACDGDATGADALPCSMAVEELIQVESCSDEEEVGDEVLCPVPGLDNINFGRFSGHTTAWVNNKYPRLSALLYDMDDGGAVGDAAGGNGAAPAVQHHRKESCEAKGSAGTTASPKLSWSAKTVNCSPAPLPPPVHYATREEAIAHFQRALGDVDPRLAYGIPLPNGESFRQVNVRLEPALMAIMRTQSPVFVVAPAVPAQGVLAFFMDLIPELSPTIRIPKGCVVEIGVKNGITVHPLLPDSLPESMTRSPLMVLPAIQEAIREVANTTFLEKKVEAHDC